MKWRIRRKRFSKFPQWTCKKISKTLLKFLPKNDPDDGSKKIRSCPKIAQQVIRKMTKKRRCSKDLKKDHELIHTLMGNDVSLRKDFIVENAINVLNLDI